MRRISRDTTARPRAGAHAEAHAYAAAVWERCASALARLVLQAAEAGASEAVVGALQGACGAEQGAGEERRARVAGALVEVAKEALAQVLV